MSVVSWHGSERDLRGGILLDGAAVDTRVGDAITSFEEELSVTSASLVRLSVLDPARRLIGSGLLDLSSDDDERLGREVELVVDDVAYWLRSVSKQLDTFELTFEDRTVCRLRDAHGTVKAAASAIRARDFIARLCSEAGVPAPVTRDPGPEEQKARKRYDGGRSTFKASADSRERAQRREPAVTAADRLTVKGSPIRPTQIAQANTLLDVAAELNAPELARVALIFAAIAESTLGDHQTTFADDGYWGVLQGQPRYFPDPRDTAALARSFLLGGKGFQSGGAIALSSTVSNPEEIAHRVEAPGGTVASAYGTMSGYRHFLPEARAIVARYGGGGETSLPGGGTVTRTTEAALTVGPEESYWDAAVRIAESYRFRFFVVSNRPYFLADEALMRSGRALTLGEASAGVTQLDWEWAPRKSLRQVELQCNLEGWDALPGSVVVLDDSCGPAGSDEEHPDRGRWLVGEYSRSRFEDSAQITLIKGRKPVVPTQTETLTVPGAVPEQGAVDASGRITAEGGAKGIVDQAAAIAVRTGGPPTYVSDRYNPRAYDSDHNEDSARRSARDIALPGINPTTSDSKIPQLERAAVAVGAAFGRTYALGQSIGAGGETFEYRGYRIEILWRVSGHYNHIHVGALKL